MFDKQVELAFVKTCTWRGSARGASHGATTKASPVFVTAGTGRPPVTSDLGPSRVRRRRDGGGRTRASFRQTTEAIPVLSQLSAGGQRAPHLRRLPNSQKSASTNTPAPPARVFLIPRNDETVLHVVPGGGVEVEGTAVISSSARWVVPPAAHHGRRSLSGRYGISDSVCYFFFDGLPFASAVKGTRNSI
ncbi:hypothetical protein OPV22_013126 [Ensete ventricosum]|uniref:Cupin type-1 domain-containing protein n=1 Tax=Ensete ventricosum TaxID=4639 RepID=A0AAV8R4Q3_ENSVE|nr:hypothetical protein OPV22_013126 [Ensete ventricosum]